MGIKLGNLNISDIYLGNTKIVSVYQGSTLIWGGDVPPVEEPFYVTSDADFTVKLTQYKSPPARPEYSTDQTNWTSLAYGTAYNFSANQKVYIRNTAYSWSSGGPNMAYFGPGCTFKKAGGNIKALVNDADLMPEKSAFIGLFETNTYIEDASELILPYKKILYGGYSEMFYGCTSLKTAPKIEAIEAVEGGNFSIMFYNCKKLQRLPAIKVTDLPNNCCVNMFSGCSEIKLSTTQDDTYKYPYRIPMSEEGTAASGALNNMFANTGGTFKGTPTINTTYYTSNEVIE